VAEDENQIVNVEVPVTWESQRKSDAAPESKQQVEINLFREAANKTPVATVAAKSKSPLPDY